jgi:hypothetical protein
MPSLRPTAAPPLGAVSPISSAAVSGSRAALDEQLGPYADELAAESEQALGRPPLGRDRALAVPDQLAGQGAQAPKAARHPESDVGELLREDERADKGARVGQLAGDDPAAACLAEADRDLRARLHEVELGQLAGAVARTLEAARRRQKARPQFPQQVIEIVLPPRYPTASSSSRMRTPDSLGSSASTSSIVPTNGSSIEVRGGRGP